VQVTFHEQHQCVQQHFNRFCKVIDTSWQALPLAIAIAGLLQARTVANGNNPITPKKQMKNV
jgi:hypothetical protein